jgi:hypothetical protein
MAKKTKQPMPTPAERLEFDLKRVREQWINAPTHLYRVGDRVVHGNITESHVIEVLDDGKVLKLHETVTENNYGRPYDHERDMYIPWHEVVPYRDFSGDKPIKGDHVFRLHYSQRSLDGLVHMFYSFGIEMDPDYQRGLVWTLEDKQALIESIFEDVDIGKFVSRSGPSSREPPGTRSSTGSSASAR